MNSLFLPAAAGLALVLYLQARQAARAIRRARAAQPPLILPQHRPPHRP
ncbi:hypothetical protein ACUXV3_07550 [Roseobacteraceae bacterium NS-SX3]